MKKLLSFLAAGALALGLIGCSGDLHDSAGEFDGYSITGEGFSEANPSWNGAGSEKLLSDGDAYSVKITPTGSTVIFCLVKTGGNWTGQINGDKISATSDIPSGIEYESADNGNGGYNAVLKNLVAGTIYTLKFGGNTGAVQISLTGADGIDASAFYISFYTIKDGKVNESKNFANKDKKAVGNKMENKKFSFVSGYTETLFYSVENAVTGEIYSNKKEFVSGKEYSFEVKGGANSFSVEEKDVGIFEHAELISNRGHDYDFYKEMKFEKTIYFESDGNPFKFYLKRDSSGDMFWDTGSIELDKELSLRYVDNRNVEADGNFKAKEVSYVSMPAFENEKWYSLSFLGTEADELKVKVENATLPDLSGHALYLIETADDSTDSLAWGTEVIKPDYKDAADPKPIDPEKCIMAKKVSDSEYTFDFDLTDKSLTKGYCTIALIKTSWWGQRIEMKKGNYEIGKPYEAGSIGVEQKPRGLIKLEAKKYKLTVTAINPVTVEFLVEEVQ